MNAVTGNASRPRAGPTWAKKESLCVSTATVKEKAKSAGAYEWYPASSEPCFPSKKGFWKSLKEQVSAAGVPTSECETKDEKKELVPASTNGRKTRPPAPALDHAERRALSKQNLLLQCTGSSLAGEFMSTHDSVETIAYTGCEHHQAPCKSENANSATTIITRQLESYVSKTIKENEV